MVGDLSSAPLVAFAHSSAHPFNSLFLSCMASPVPAPMEASTSDTQRSLMPTPLKKHTPEKALKHHDSIMKSTQDFMHALSVDKADSLMEATKLRHDDTPVHHQNVYPFGEVTEMPSIKGYDNSEYHAKVHRVKEHGPTLEAHIAHLDTHIDRLQKHKEQQKVAFKLNQARKMQATLHSARPLIHDHVEDDGAKKEIMEYITNGRNAGESPVPRNTDDIARKMEGVDRVLKSMPLTGDRRADALKNHDKLMGESIELLHGTADKKAELLNRQASLRAKGLPVTHKIGYGLQGGISNREYRNAVDEMKVHREKVIEKLGQAKKHVETIGTLNAEKATQAAVIHDKLSIAKDMLQAPVEDRHAQEILGPLFTVGRPPVPSSAPHYAVEKAIVEDFRKNLPKMKSKSKPILTGLPWGKGKAKATH
jgi:hypothetical protein